MENKNKKKQDLWKQRKIYYLKTAITVNNKSPGHFFQQINAFIFINWNRFVELFTQIHSFSKSSTMGFQKWLPIKGMFPAGIYFLQSICICFSRAMCEVCSKLTIKTPERREWHLHGVFIINVEQISKMFLVFPSKFWCKSGT